MKFRRVLLSLPFFDLDDSPCLLIYRPRHRRLGRCHAALGKAISSIKAANDAGLEQAADATLRQIIADPAFDQFLALPDVAFPVAVLTPEQQVAIAAKARVVVLPEGVYRKQLGEMPQISRGHPELTVADYRLLPAIVSFHRSSRRKIDAETRNLDIITDNR